mmetsp:Transcript_4676/g.11465  ORF Transcript_4676/g.11465 Transcript_4676/m.11465 type:complete len:239 (-) Transcript_4676:423-1139(-)
MGLLLFFFHAACWPPLLNMLASQSSSERRQALVQRTLVFSGQSVWCSLLLRRSGSCQIGSGIDWYPQPHAFACRNGIRIVDRLEHEETFMRKPGRPRRSFRIVPLPKHREGVHPQPSVKEVGKHASDDEGKDDEVLEVFPNFVHGTCPCVRIQACWPGVFVWVQLLFRYSDKYALQRVHVLRLCPIEVLQSPLDLVPAVSQVLVDRAACVGGHDRPGRRIVLDLRDQRVIDLCPPHSA